MSDNYYSPSSSTSSSRGTLRPYVPGVQSTLRLPAQVPQRAGWVQQSAVSVAPEKCARRKSQTSYAKCVARQAAKNARATWVRCKVVGATVQKQKGVSRTAKRKLKKEQVRKCLRVGR